ncbi:uncharacterized protein LOC128236449 isoform X1 [Mya arenaria]|uniref:uncharacterized protein LOC128236449 isoform X1 n=1 Tax=Mya arenaria TaxID=6604 RepID=UPI0022E9001C|nr:uncharacterized protein LOC128236449 isoform X1 [Mya arenaria]
MISFIQVASAMSGSGQDINPAISGGSQDTQSEVLDDKVPVEVDRLETDSVITDKDHGNGVQQETDIVNNDDTQNLKTKSTKQTEEDGKERVDNTSVHDVDTPSNDESDYDGNFEVTYEESVNTNNSDGFIENPKHEKSEVEEETSKLVTGIEAESVFSGIDVRIVVTSASDLEDSSAVVSSVDCSSSSDEPDGLSNKNAEGILECTSYEEVEDSGINSVDASELIVTESVQTTENTRSTDDELEDALIKDTSINNNDFDTVGLDHEIVGSYGANPEYNSVTEQFNDNPKLQNEEISKRENGEKNEPEEEIVEKATHELTTVSLIIHENSDLSTAYCDSDLEDIERAKEAFITCIKEKRELRDKSKSRDIDTVCTFNELDIHEDTSVKVTRDLSAKCAGTQINFEKIKTAEEQFETFDHKETPDSKETIGNCGNTRESGNVTPTCNSFTNSTVEPESRVNCLAMPEGREGDGCVSPSLTHACCRYRWERTIFTQATSVVFVTLNNKDIEPIKLSWSEGSRCFYSDEVKVPVGGYVGNLVIDGTFYPVEDVNVKHYTFEVDLYLKDDILEDEGRSTGVAKAEQFVRDQQHNENQETNTAGKEVTYTPTRASRSFTHPQTRAGMDTGNGDNVLSREESESSIHLSNKYEDLVRNQLTSSKGAMSGNESESELSQRLKTDFPDLNGRGTPVGEDSVKQYQDGDDTLLKSMDMGHVYRSENGLNGNSESFKNSLLDDYLEKRSVQSNDSLGRGGKSSPVVIDDVLGTGHSRTPIYSTESPVVSRHNSAHSSARHTPLDNIDRPASVNSLHSKHSSARQTPVLSDDVGRPDSSASQPSRHSSVLGSARQTPTEGREHGRPGSAEGSVHSGNSVGRHVLDELITDALGRENRSPSREGSTNGRPESVGSAHSNDSSRQRINELINEAFDSTRQARSALSESSGTGSQIGSQSGSRPRTPQEQIGDVLSAADRHSPIRRDYLNGSPYGSNMSVTSAKSAHESLLGSTHSTPTRGSVQESKHSSVAGSAPGSQRQTPQRELIHSTLNASQEKLYQSTDVRKLVGSDYAGSNASNQGSRPQSVTSEQELTQYYEGVTEGARQGSRTASASSLPVIGAAQRYTPDKRSMTPDGHVRVPFNPVSKSPLLPPRTPQSNTSSRTVTPMNGETESEMNLREQIKDLDSLILNLRKQLNNREQEMSEVRKLLEDSRETNQHLQGETDRLRARASPGPQIGELERRLVEMTEDRDSLTQEVARLKEEAKLRNEPGLNRYNPNSPTTLQRKIDELKSQVQDLHEANEAAMEEVRAGERRIKELAAEKETLRVTQDDRTRDLQEEVRHQRTELTRLREHSSTYNEASDYRTKIELQQIKEDNRNLRERNYQLHDDNIRLKEELSDLRKSLELVDSARKSYKDEGRRSLTRMDGYDKKEELEREQTKRRSDPLIDISYTRQTNTGKPQYETRTDIKLADLPASTDRLSKLDAYRYESYRTGPDGRSEEKLRSSLSLTRPLTPEKSRGRHRTSSAELDFRSMPLSAYNSDMSKTTPNLSGRSRAIYDQISNKRSGSRSNMEGQEATIPEHTCESADDFNTKSMHTDHTKMHHELQENKPENECGVRVKQTDQIAERVGEGQSKSQSSKILMAQYISDSQDTTDPTLGERCLLDRGDNFRRKENSREEKGFDVRQSQQLSAAYQDDGNMSDTPTDILVSAQPTDKLTAASWRRRQRRGSAGSDASNSSFSDIDEQISSAVRKRSKSADGREILRRMGPTGMTSGEKTLSRTISPAPAGLRTVTTRPLITQHNKSSLSLSTSLTSLTSGLRPFAPRSPGDLQVNDVIKFSRQGGKLSQGTIKFIGHLPGRGDIYLGVELDKEDGKHDGVFEDIRYFKCKPTKGVFVAYNKVVMAWTSY